MQSAGKGLTLAGLPTELTSKQLHERIAGFEVTVAGARISVEQLLKDDGLLVEDKGNE